MLESGFKYLVRENQKVITQLESEEGFEKIQKVVGDYYEKNGSNAIIQEVDATPEELIILASCEMENIEMK